MDKIYFSIMKRGRYVFLIDFLHILSYQIISLLSQHFLPISLNKTSIIFPFPFIALSSLKTPLTPAFPFPHSNIIKMENEDNQ